MSLAGYHRSGRFAPKPSTQTEVIVSGVPAPIAQHTEAPIRTPAAPPPPAAAKVLLDRTRNGAPRPKPTKPADYRRKKS